MNTLRLYSIVFVCIALLSLAVLLWSSVPPSITQLDPLVVHSETSRLTAVTQGHPDLFFQYHHDIRASADGTNEYPMGYRIKELNKALAVEKNSSTKLNWVERGPGNVGGRTRPILVDPDDPLNTWWAGSVSGGLWNTTDRGLTWQPATDDLPNLAVSSLAMAESDPSVIYMGTGEGVGYFSSVAGDGVFKSVDRGRTWNHLSATASNNDFRFVNRLAVDPTNPDVVLAATGAGVFRTVDGGISWNAAYRSTSESEPVQDLRSQPGNFNTQIASVGGRGILYSTDGGMTWAFASVDWASRFYRIELAYSPSSPERAYAAVHAWTTHGGFKFLSDLYLSEDGGFNWVRTVSHSDVNWFGPQGWYNNTLAVHPFSPDTVFVGGIDLQQNRIIGKNALLLVSEFDYGGTDEWIEFKPVLEVGLFYRIEERIYPQHPYAADVASTDYTDIEIRWGQGTQLAHRFWVPETAGLFSNGGVRVPYHEYMYADYVEVPFQVWDTENNRQLMVSFRDQADDGEFDLIRYSRHYQNSRNETSMEYMYIHKYEYNAAVAHDSIAQNGGWRNGLLYMLWPVLDDNPTVTWDPANLPNQTITVKFESAGSPRRDLDVLPRQFDIARATHVDHHAIVPIPLDGARSEFWVLDANDGGIALSTDNGRSFRELDHQGSGYNTMQVYGVAKKPGASVYIAGSQDNGTWRSPDNPDNRLGWTKQGVGDGFETVWHATDPDKILASEQYTSIGRTVDGGTTWESSLAVPNPQFYTQIASSDKAPDNVYTVGKTGVWYSRNFGETWTMTPITGDYWNRWSGCRVRVSIADPSVVWAGCGLISNPSDTRLLNKLHVSRDMGESFGAAAFPVMSRPPEAYLSGLATHPTEPSTAYALFSRYSRPKILETKDYGQTWTDLSGFATSDVSTNGFPDVAVFDLVVIPRATNVLWVGTEIGIFESRNHGEQWSYADNGLPAVAVWQMKIRDGEVILGTHGRGVWTVPLGEVVKGGPVELQFVGIVANQTFTVGAAIRALILPEASGGLEPYSYALDPALPTGLVFDESTLTISGEPMEVTAATPYSYSAVDNSGLSASLTFTIEVASAISFEDIVADQSYARTHPITPLALPEAVGGVPPIGYTLTPELPPGLSFDASTSTITGTPTVVTSAPVPYTYKATDANGSTDSLQFSIEVYSPVDVEHETVPESFALRGTVTRQRPGLARIIPTRSSIRPG